jgi:hypothetical protein
MPPIPFADNFLAGSLISLLMPTLLLIAIVVWYVTSIRRGRESGRSGSPDLPPGAVTPTPAATADDGATGPGGAAGASTPGGDS